MTSTIMTRAVRFCAVVLLTLAPSIALAQTTVRVTVDRATLWRPGFNSLVTVVSENQELEVVGRQGDWLEIVVPAGSSQDRTAMISINQVTLVSGTLPPDGATAPSQRPPSQPPPPLDSGFRGFGDVSYHFFTANDTFEAVFDQPGGAFFGGGAEFRLRQGLFLQVAARFFKKTGERVFVLDDEVFPLGIENEVTITPIAFTAGWRFRPRGAIPYVGGGGGTYRLQESSAFEDPLEKVDERFSSYHVLAGAEFRGRGWVAGAVEVQYTLVPDALSKGLSDIYDEHDLGGFDVRFKIVIGR